MSYFCCKWLLQMTAANGFAANVLFLLQMVAADDCCKWFCCKWPILVAANDCCEWFCCKWPKFRGSVETGLLQMTLLQMTIHHQNDAFDAGFLLRSISRSWKATWGQKINIRPYKVRFQSLIKYDKLWLVEWKVTAFHCKIRMSLFEIWHQNHHFENTTIFMIFLLWPLLKLKILFRRLFWSWQVHRRG